MFLKELSLHLSKSILVLMFVPLIGCVIAEAPFPANLMTALAHSVYVKGDHTNFDIEPSFGVEASELYPDVKYTTVDEYLSQFA